MTTVIIPLLTLPIYLLMLWPLVVASRRVLGVRIRTVRALIGAAIGWAVARQVMLSLFPVLGRSTGAFVGLLIPIAGASFLATLIFLFLAEMAFPSGGGLGVVGRVRSLRRRIARARRYSQVSRIAVRHGIGQYLAGRRGDVERQAVLARSLRRALEDGGVTFVKLGQVLSTRPDLLPPAFIDELSPLQDQVAPVDPEAIERELADALGRPLDEVFAVVRPRADRLRVDRAGVRRAAAQRRGRRGEGAAAGHRPGRRARPRHRRTGWRGRCSCGRGGRVRSAWSTWPTGSPPRSPRSSTSGWRHATSPRSRPRTRARR